MERSLLARGRPTLLAIILSPRILFEHRLRVNFSSALAGSRGSEGQPGAHQRADHAAFEQLFTSHSPAIFEYLCGMTHGDRELASDLVQETFLRAYRARTPLADIEHPHAWLFRIATNLALTARRRRAVSLVSLGVVEPQPEADSSDRWRLPRALVEHSRDVAADAAERDIVWQVLTELPPRWRAALLLQTTNGFTAREIAALLGLSEANVRKIIYRAKERFRATYLALEARTAQEGGH